MEEIKWQGEQIKTFPGPVREAMQQSTPLRLREVFGLPPRSATIRELAAEWKLPPWKVKEAAAPFVPGIMAFAADIDTKLPPSTVASITAKLRP